MNWLIERRADPDYTKDDEVRDLEAEAESMRSGAHVHNWGAWCDSMASCRCGLTLDEYEKARA